MPYVLDENGEVVGSGGWDKPMPDVPTQPTGYAPDEGNTNPNAYDWKAPAVPRAPSTPMQSSDPYTRAWSYAQDNFRNPNIYSRDVVPVVVTRPDGSSYVGLDNNPNYNPTSYSVPTGFDTPTITSTPPTMTPATPPPYVSKSDTLRGGYVITPSNTPTTPTTATPINAPTSMSDTLRSQTALGYPTNEPTTPTNPFPKGTRESDAYDEYQKRLWAEDKAIKDAGGIGLSASDQMRLWIDVQDKVGVYRDGTVGKEALNNMGNFVRNFPNAKPEAITNAWNNIVKELKAEQGGIRLADGTTMANTNNALNMHSPYRPQTRTTTTTPPKTYFSGYATGGTFVVGERRPELINVQPMGNRAQVTVTPLQRTQNGYRLDPNPPSQQRPIPRQVQGYRLPGYAYGDRFITEPNLNYFDYSQYNNSKNYPDPNEPNQTKYEIYPLKYRGVLQV